MYFAKTIFSVCLLAAQGMGVYALEERSGNSTCITSSSVPVGYVQTYAAYACRGDLQTWNNVTSGVCINAQNFTTARGYRKGGTPANVDCTFNFYSTTDCKGAFTSAGKDADGSNNWTDCVRNFLSVTGETATSGSSFMYACYPRY